MFSSAKPNENERSACEQVPMARHRKPERWFLEVPNCFCHVSKLFSTFGASGRKRAFQQLRPIFLNTRTVGVNIGLRRVFRRTRRLPRVYFNPHDASPVCTSALSGPGFVGGSIIIAAVPCV
jgi:hypothetical protein